ncbi:conserved protein of unknown function [Limnospira indica PCC 8005]|uniref:Uncharacterized protein n=1 Tax=Limnospira indica PCC 8005 TaxID=376219 RepID=A0A9P1KGE8_9CYAN|nr:conserved protein of unknown function [Limnospira indica PCC 8005]
MLLKQTFITIYGIIASDFCLTYSGTSVYNIPLIFPIIPSLNDY